MSTGDMRAPDRITAVRRLVGERAGQAALAALISAVLLPRVGVDVLGRHPVVAVPVALATGAWLFGVVARPDRTWSRARHSALGRLLAAALVLAGAAAEEALFRGALLTAVATVAHPLAAPVALVATSAAFAAVHAPYGRAAAATQLGVGATFGILALATGGLLAPLVAHGAYNLGWYELRPSPAPPEAVTVPTRRPVP
jgi:membrane protease YdiL (CAAX protease family)